MVTDEQVKLLMSLLKQGISQATAAAKAGMSERTARKYVRSGGTPSVTKVPHTWRTRVDPFGEVWAEIETLLKQDSGLQAKTVWAELNRRGAGTVQRRTAAHAAATISRLAHEVGTGVRGVLSADARAG